MSPLFFFGLQENILDAYVCYVIVFKFSVLQGPKGSSGKNTKEYSHACIFRTRIGVIIGN